MADGNSIQIPESEKDQKLHHRKRCENNVQDENHLNNLNYRALSKNFRNGEISHIRNNVLSEIDINSSLKVKTKKSPTKNI